MPTGYTIGLRQLIAQHSDTASLSLGTTAGPALTYAATNVSTETEFAVVNPDGGVATFYMAGNPGMPGYAVTTAGTTVTIPDLAVIGLALPAASPTNGPSLPVTT